MSLYGDLPQAKGDDGAAGQKKGWSAAASKLQPSLRKPAGGFAPTALLRAGGAGGRGPGPAGRSLPAPGRGRGSSSSSSAAAAADGAGPGCSSVSTSGQPAPSSAAGGPIVVSALGFFSTHGEPIADEYDPARPNDYEDVLKGRERARRAAEDEAERVKRQREAEVAAQQAQQEIERRKREQAEAAAAVLAMSRPGGAEGRGSPGPPRVKDEPGAGGSGGDADERERRLKLSGDEAFAARARLSRRGPDAGPGPGGGGGTHSSSGGGGGGGEGPKGLGLAQKLLEKMGWREGEGLGRNRQGIATPLVAQKRGDHAAIIVSAPERPRPDGEAPPEKRPRPGASLSGRPTRVLVLRNMVGPGQVDEDLEEEVGNELSKYGQVVDVKIFEVLSPGFEAAEAVRIFVQFDRSEAAVKAAIDLQGRFFGGKEVRVAFFPEDRFDAQDLAPKAGEFDRH
ncbi:MAG: hypothetical protein J3K34DRAFT_494743 [Monoraphidium minutum]|nr:MAG: hypothetical protein J3K34DRAFT_494743 [Monoraphidium minutum]